MVAFYSDTDLSSVRDTSNSTKKSHGDDNVAYYIDPADDELSVYNSDLGIMVVCISQSTLDSLDEVPADLSAKQKAQNAADLKKLSNLRKQNHGWFWSWADPSSSISSK